jgi:hypothetical protein
MVAINFKASEVAPARMIDFKATHAAAMTKLPQLLKLLLPDGQVNGHEYEARDLCYADPHVGILRVNLRNGKWKRLATGERGYDVISLFAFIHNVSQGRAAHLLADMLECPDMGGTNAADDSKSGQLTS